MESKAARHGRTGDIDVKALQEKLEIQKASLHSFQLEKHALQLENNKLKQEHHEMAAKLKDVSDKHTKMANTSLPQIQKLEEMNARYVFMTINEVAMF